MRVWSGTLPVSAIWGDDVKTTILLLVIGAAALAACGDEKPPTDPVLPIAEWVKIATFLCPDIALTDEDCTIDVEGDTLIAGRIYIQEHHFINAEYLFGILSWPLQGASSCADSNSDGRCVLFGVWGAFDFALGNQRLAFRLVDPINYRFDYFLMVGGIALADTSFEWHAKSAGVNSGSAATGFLSSPGTLGEPAPAR